MYTSTVIRWSKVALVAGTGLFATLVTLNNLTDYQANFRFVQHVLSMDTTFPDNQLMGRAITDPILHHAAYWIIIAFEALTALLCLWGALRLWHARIGPSDEFNRAKGTAVAGLTVGILLWLVGFMVIGGEWFLMWQSETWNGQEAAFRFLAILSLVLIYLVVEDRE
jgi:predicted small integral membrane protein